MAFGVFDGIHRGHQWLISRAIQDAEARGTKSAVLTFDHDPDELFAPERLMKLMTNSECILELARTGVDIVAVLPFDYAFAAMSPEEFLAWAFGGGCPASLHVGEGFRFAANEAGTVADLERWDAPRGMQVYEHRLLRAGGARVSSTRIRHLIAEGRISRAQELLGKLA